MCGLVGVYSANMMMKHENVLKSLLYLDTWRGTDSTGVAAIRHNTDTSVLKQTVPGYEFIEGPRLTNHLKLNDFCWIGHNRAGTIGGNIRTNAHPFMVLDEDGACSIVGAHNGTLKNKHVLSNHARYGTDSEALFNHIAETSLKEALAIIEGAWALTYYDHEKEELHMVRNDQRPLYFAFEKDRHTVLWASEEWMLHIACSRHGVELEEVVEVEPDTLYAFPVPLKITDKITYTMEGGHAGKASTFFQNTSNQANWWSRENQSQTTTTDGQKGTTPGRSLTTTDSSTTQRDKSGDKPLSPKSSSSTTPLAATKKYKGYKGIALSFQEMEEHLAGGCAWCESNVIEVEDRHAWLDVKKPICHSCLTDTYTVTPVTQ